MSWTCPRCGANHYHYSPARMALVCDGCGTPIPDPAREQQQQAHDRSYQQALEHLRVGNWDQSISILQGLASQTPADARIYEALLRAATQNFQDLDLTSSTRRSAARSAWDKLLRLGSCSGTMMDYSRRLARRQHARLETEWNSICKLFQAAGVLLVLAGLCALGDSGGLSFLFVVIAGYCVYAAFQQHPQQLLDRMHAPDPDPRQNPF